jgi:hypothetical protein
MHDAGLVAFPSELFRDGMGRPMAAVAPVGPPRLMRASPILHVIVMVVMVVVMVSGNRGRIPTRILCTAPELDPEVRAGLSLVREGHG